MSEFDPSASEHGDGRPPGDRLDSWKEIAAYLKRDIRTVQRWEKLEGLPVHRHLHQQRGSAFAYRAEVDAWWSTRGAALPRPDTQGSASSQGEAGAFAPPSAGGSQATRLRWARNAIWVTAAAAALIVAALFFSRQNSRPAAQAIDHRILSDFPGGAGGASFSPDGSMIAFHRTSLDDAGPLGPFQIWVQHLTGGKPLQLTFDDSPSASPCWSSKGDQILFNHRRGIWSVSPLGGTPRLVIDNGINPRFSRDGTQIVFEDAAPGRGIRVVDADGSNPRLVAEKGGFPASPALSPDARRVAFFQSEYGPLGDIWVVSTEGGTPRRLTFDSTEAGGPVWTPDGRFIVFYSSRAGSQTLWRISAEGGTPYPVTSGAGQDRDPDISRDGKQLVYSNFRITFALMLHEPALGRQRELLQSRLFVGMPRFSPDGGRIAFSRQLDDAIHVFTVGVDGQDVRQVTEGTGQRNLLPHWPADAAWLYFFRARPVPSLRKASVIGGDAVEVGSWSKGEPSELDPFGNAVAYLRTTEGRPSATVVRSLAAGHEIMLDTVVQDPRWSPDAQTIVGWQSAAESDTPRVVSCAVPQGTCRVVVERGFAPVVAPDGSRILFFRWPGALGRRELWSIRPDGHDATLVASLGPFGLGATFDVSRRGDVVYPLRRETRSELWRAEFR